MLTRRGLLGLFGGAAVAGTVGLAVNDEPILAPIRSVAKQPELRAEVMRKALRGVKVRLNSFMYTVEPGDEMRFELNVENLNDEIVIQFCVPKYAPRPPWLHDREIYIDFEFPEKGPEMYINGLYYKACTITSTPRDADLIDITSWDDDGRHFVRGL